jgi:hypothetical protein
MSVNLFDIVTLSDADTASLKAQYDEISLLKQQIGSLLNDVAKMERNAWLFVRTLHPEFQNVEVRFNAENNSLIVISLTP